MMVLHVSCRLHRLCARLPAIETPQMSAERIWEIIHEAWVNGNTQTICYHDRLATSQRVQYSDMQNFPAVESWATISVVPWKES